MKDMLGRLQDFSISGEEDVLGLEDDLVLEGKETVRLGLVGRLLSKKYVRREIFSELFRSLWKPRGALDIRQLPTDTFLFNFDTEEDWQWVILTEPWHFDKL